MTKREQVYKCEICGNIVEVLHAGKGKLVCCGKPMKLLGEKSKGEYAEKHAPVIEQADAGIKVKIGAVPHPMQKKHYIEWVEVLCGDAVLRVHLTSEDEPEAYFPIKISDVKQARMYCNVHGLWTH
tara:strand:- start:165 stop:542 length:378 start_codon:yes stop_codon:yes gene_type:complete